MKKTIESLSYLLVQMLILVTFSQFSAADIDMCCDPMLSSGSDVVLTGDAYIDYLDINLNTLEVPTLYLNGSGTLGKAAQLLVSDMYLSGGQLGVAELSTITAASSLNIGGIYPGENYQLSISGGSTVQTMGSMYVKASSVVDVYSSNLAMAYMKNEGTVNVYGSQSKITQIINSNSFPIRWGVINFFDQADYSADYLVLQFGDKFSAYGSGSDVYITRVADVSGTGTLLRFENGATFTSDWEVDVSNGGALEFIGANTVSRMKDVIINTLNNEAATLSLKDGAKISTNYIWSSSGSRIDIVNGGEIDSNTIINRGDIVVIGKDNMITVPVLENYGTISVDGKLTVLGDLLLAEGSGFVFSVSNQADGPALVLDGGFSAGGTVDIQFNLSDLSLPDSEFSMDLISFGSSVPNLSIFNIDFSIFDGWGDQWNVSSDIEGDRLVLNVVSAVPIPGSIWMMLSSIVVAVSLRCAKGRRPKLFGADNIPNFC